LILPYLARAGNDWLEIKICWQVWVWPGLDWNLLIRQKIS